MAQPYQDSLEHLLAELRRLDLMLCRAVMLARQARSGDPPEEFRGLAMPGGNVDLLLDVDFLGNIWALDPDTRPTIEILDAELESRLRELSARAAASQHEGVRLALPRLATTFNLSPAEVDVVLIALAPELEPRYETLYAYLQSDVARTRPSMDLCLNLICRNVYEKIRARQLLAPDSQLLRHHLVELHTEPHDRDPTRLRQFLRLNEAVTRFLIERQPRRNGVTGMLSSQPDLETLETSANTRTELRNLAAALRRDGQSSTVIQLWGRGDAPLQEAAGALAHELDRSTLYTGLAALGQGIDEPATLIRNALLWESLIVINRGREPAQEAERAKLHQLEAMLLASVADNNLAVVMLSEDEQFGNVAGPGQLWRVRIDGADYDTRLRAWQGEVGSAIAANDLERLADTFSFAGARVQQTVSLARARMALRGASETPLSVGEILAAGRDLTNPSVNQFAIPIEPRFGWDDLVLPPDEMRQLRGVADRLQYRSLVHRDWRFGCKLSRGRGLAVLFTGSSGSGKTMAAEVLARELSLRMLQIDLATVMSKYIGETEAHLSLIFREAERSQSLLFFDEADALFGKRTEVTDARDRFANIQVNYLLQRIEQYEGLVVLATNFQENIDEAFLRRLQCVVRFPFPDEAARAQIWQRQFPKQAPLAQPLDYPFLATQFKLSGGNIRNAALEAAFLAAHEKGAEAHISMTHVIEAVKHEYQKQGKLVMKTDLGRYWRSA